MNKCPYCGLEPRDDYPVEFRCGSVLNRHRSKACLVLEIGQLKERVEELEEARTKAAANSLANMLTHEEAMAKMAALIEAGDELAAVVWRDYRAYCEKWTKAKDQP